MELRTLTTTFMPDQLVENYKSLVWTERYLPAGDFQLVTFDVDATMALLPIGTMIAVKDGYDCMFVESHVVEKDPDGAMTLTVTGRSFETFFENRIAHEQLYAMFELNEQAPPTYDWQLALNGEAASKYAYEIIRYRSMMSGDPATYIPNLTCTISSNATMAGGKPRRFMRVKIGEVYERLMEILAMDDLGIRTILPAVGQTNITIHIYAGVDVSTNVVLSVSAGHFEKVAYAWTNRDFKNATIAHSEWDWLYSAGSSGSGVAGLNRRFGWVDATDITRKTPPDLGDRVDAKELASRSATYLKQHKAVSTFACEVSSDIPFKISVDYALGDIVRVMADYGTNQLMRVTEYIRIEDEEGERAYPTLELP